MKRKQERSKIRWTNFMLRFNVGNMKMDGVRSQPPSQCLLGNRLHFMRFIPLIFGLVIFAGCESDDPRLQGTWHSNREATVAAAFQRDPRWEKATPERVDHFKDLFGQLTVTYSNRVSTIVFKGETNSCHYRVVERGTNFVVTRSDSPLEPGDVRLQFIDGDKAYWVGAPFGLQERFDKIEKP
jgi:hypothetical protein